MENQQDNRLSKELQNLRVENDRLRGLLSLLSDLSVQITSSLDLPTVLQTVVNSACQLTSARYGALGLFDPNSRIEQFITYGVTPEERQRIGDPPVGLGILGWLHNLQKPLRLAELSQHSRSVGFPPNHPPMKTFLGAPIIQGGQHLGTLYLTEKDGGREFTPEDESMLVLFAAQAAMAVHNAQQYQERRDAEEAAELERQRLDALVDTSPVGVFVLEASSKRVVVMNQEAQRILGITRGQADQMEQYHHTATCYFPDGKEYSTEELPTERALRIGETIRAEEIRLEFPDGHSLPILVNVTPVYSTEGEITAAITVIQDMTPLEELERLRSEFLGIVGHELRTPLTAIKGSAATVLGSRRPLDQSEIREFFEIIDEQADRLRDLVDNLMDLTRIEAGRLSVSTESTNLQEILEDAKNTFVRAGGTQDILMHVADNLPAVQADRRRIFQVVSNLLTNAAKFSPPTMPITIEVTYDAVHAKVGVNDQGNGIAKDNLTHLFKKFSQVHQDIGNRLSGTGLGLAICKGIVEAHGGRIWAESPGAGHGSTFSFTLLLAPEAPGVPQDVPTIDTTSRAQHVGRVSKSGERTQVVAIDDDPQVLRYIERTLTEAGYQATVSSDPTQTTSLVELEEPDLVLLDLTLPGISGFELLQRIREFSGVPVIFLTGRDRDEDIVQALKMGADDYITKPFSPSELLARIEAALRRRLMPDQIEVRPPFVLGELIINFAERRVLVGGREIPLTATEYKVLYELANHAGLVLTHDQILQRVWGEDYSGEVELVRSFIRNLRHKLGDDARNPTYVFTQPQVGYRMPRPPTAAPVFP